MPWGAVAGAVVSNVVGSALADDSGGSQATSAASDAAGMQAQIAKEQWNKYQEIYDPLESQYVKEAQNYDTPENYAKAAGEASATTSEQFSKARDRLNRTPGLDPSQGAYTANLMGLNLAQAATDATQQNAARQKVKDTAFARKTDALSLGKGLPAQASASLANSASANMGLANAANDNANMYAGAAGRVVGNLFNAGAKWLDGNNGSGNGSTPSGSGSNTGNFNYETDTPNDLGGTSYI